MLAGIKEGLSRVFSQSDEPSVTQPGSSSNPLTVACFDGQTGRPELRRQNPFGTFTSSTADIGLNHSVFAGPSSDAVTAMRPISEAVASKRPTSREDLQTLILMAAKNP